MLGGADHANGDLPSYITGANTSSIMSVTWRMKSLAQLHVTYF